MEVMRRGEVQRSDPFCAFKSGILSNRVSVPKERRSVSNVSGKDSAWTPPRAGLTRTRVLHRRDGANCLLPLLLGEGWGEVGKSKDQRKPFGCAITRFSFPPK